MRLALAVLLTASIPAAAVASDTSGRDTTEQRIQGGDRAQGFSFLSLGAGQAHVVREDLTAAKAGREQRRRSLAYFAQLSDFQLADEESPARVEFTDRIEATFSSAWRPQEALMAHTVDASIRQVNAFAGASPVAQAGGTRAPMDYAITTGDNADNQQRNEAEWVATLLAGGRIAPNSGSADPADYASCPPGTPGVDEAARYTGVQDYDDYVDSGLYYDPDQPAGVHAGWPSYPGLMDRAQQPFDTPGLDVPSYVAPGNHDLLVQGNQAASAPIETIATGCVKVMGPSLAGNATFADAFTQLLNQTSPQHTTLVPPDPERAFLSRPEYRAMFAASQSDAHGFAFVDPAELEASNGAASYYDYVPRPGVRMISLDTTADAGIAGITHNGNVDDPQFRWLEGRLQAAQKAGEVVVLYSHHAPVSLVADPPDEVAPPCTAERIEDDPNPGCDLDPRSSSPIHLGDDMVALALKYPNVVAWVAGHSHVNDIQPYAREDESGGFYVIRTSAEADWPHQDRLVEIMDNRDGTLSVFGTLIDNASAAAAPPAGTAAADMSVDQLASLARTLGYNDPDLGGGTGEGDAADNNVELLVVDPFPGRASANGKLRVKVLPRRVRAGRRTTLRVRVTSRKRPVAGARVRAFGRKARTGRRGRARLSVRPGKPGLRRVRARKGKAPVRRASAPVLVVRRSSATRPARCTRLAPPSAGLCRASTLGG